MIRTAVTLAASLLLLPTAAAQEPQAAGEAENLSRLRAGFDAPPPEARLRCYWWWLNGNTDAATITHDLEEMKSKGFGGALLVDANGANQNGNRDVPPGPTFASAAWIALFTHALKEADRLGLEITFNITSGWNLGGPDVTPEQAAKLLTFSRTTLERDAQVIHLAAPQARAGFYRRIAVLAYPLLHGVAMAAQPDDAQGDRHTAEHGADAMRSEATLRYRSAAAETGFSMPDAAAMLNDGTERRAGPFAGDPGFADTAAAGVIDISSKVTADGAVNWTPPAAGTWEILEVGYTASGAKVSTASGAWQGLAIDYLSRKAFTSYWARTVEPLLTAARPYRSLRYLATDSWELGGTNWTDDFRQQFLRLRGYDPVPWLPVIAGRIVDDRSQSTRFLTDLRRTVADLIVSEHYDVFAAKAREHGMGVQAESGGPHGAPIDALETFRHAAIPQTEFWSENPHRSTDHERFFTKEAASAANIYGQRFVAQEGETSIGPQWSESLATDLKPSFDMAITEGMNRLVWHEFTSSPASTGLPGQEYFAGTHLNPKVTWWNAAAPFFTYLNRAQFLMQQGTAVNDVLYFYGDHVPNFVRLKADDPAHVLPHYDYDVTGEDALLHNIQIEGRELVGPSGVRWRLLALPSTRRLSMAVLEFVERYVRAGGSVAGAAPISPTGRVSPEAQSAYSELAAKVWAGCERGSSHTYGSGRVFCAEDASAALGAMDIEPDFAASLPQNLVASSKDSVDYAHRRLGSVDVYFVRNPRAEQVDLRASFRVHGKTAELWDGVTGEMRAADILSSRPDHTELALRLPAYGSVFVVFHQGKTQAVGLPGAERLEPLRTSGPWRLSFEPGRGAPAEAVELGALTSWSDSAEAGIRYFSGTGTYRAIVEAPTLAGEESVSLQFTSVREIAKVRVNGVEAGVVWAAPYGLEVGRYLHPGANQLEIEVTNLWPNRLIGDQQPGSQIRVTRTNITSYKADSPLLPSGLIGPVMWRITTRQP